MILILILLIYKYKFNYFLINIINLNMPNYINLLNMKTIYNIVSKYLSFKF